MTVTLVSGVTGVGLSSICQEVRRSLSEDYKLINFGDSMLEQAATHNITTDRDELTSLSPTETRRLQRRAGEYVADQAATSNIILTTHLAVQTRAGYVHGLPDDVLRDVAPSAFVLVEASPETIIERREASDRELKDVTPRAVEFEQDLNRTAALEYARDRGAPVQFVENQDSIDDAAMQIAERLESA
ncbi:adenylate kinase [Salinibaculum rarum]|uniref:adenylate kinase n=1 Tax=Salinibaculum rarum TaxID=3058903 RepID=UPI00265F74B5|nr:adenylate kinase [Salinibaculum sp. KK48]